MSVTINAASLMVTAKPAGFDVTKNEIRAMQKVIESTTPAVVKMNRAVEVLDHMMSQGDVSIQAKTAAINALRKAYGMMGDVPKLDMNKPGLVGPEIPLSVLHQRRQEMMMIQADEERASFRRQTAMQFELNIRRQVRQVAESQLSIEQQVARVERRAERMRAYGMSVQQATQYITEQTNAIHRQNGILTEQERITKRIQDHLNAQSRNRSAFRNDARAGLSSALSYAGGGQLASLAGMGARAGAVGLVGTTIVGGLAAKIKQQQAEALIRGQTGDDKKGIGISNEMIEMSKVMPINLKAMQDAASIMLPFGVEADKLTDRMKRLNMIAAGNADRFQRLALVYSQTTSTGKLMGQDLLQYVAAGFNPLAEIAKKLGISMAEAREQMEKGLVPASMLDDVLVELTQDGGKYQRILDEQSRTLSGHWSITMNKGYAALINFGDAFDEVGHGIVFFIEKTFDGVNALFDLQEQIAKMTGLKKNSLEVSFEEELKAKELVDANNERLRLEGTLGAEFDANVARQKESVKQELHRLELRRQYEGGSMDEREEAGRLLELMGDRIAQEDKIRFLVNEQADALNMQLLHLQNPAMARWMEAQRQGIGRDQFEMLEAQRAEIETFTKIQRLKKQAEQDRIAAQEKEMNRLADYWEQIMEDADPLRGIQQRWQDLDLMLKQGTINRDIANAQRDKLLNQVLSKEEQPKAMWPEIIRAGSSEAIKSAQEARFKEHADTVNDAKQRKKEMKDQLDATLKTNELLEEIKNRPQTIGTIN